MISYILPTRNRPERLAMTLAAIGSLRGHEAAGAGSAEVIVVDNNSTFPPTPPERLANGLPIRVIYRESNEGAASRNVAAAAADPRSEWVVMLDDDSYPADTGFIRRLAQAPPDVAAISADIYLPGMGQRESGGLPEVFIGCGVAIRRQLFLDLGGYDPSFNYYVEEYDLAARIMLAGYRIAFDPWFRVEHHKVAQNRDMDLILSRLVRNNGWVMQRYAPEELRRPMLREQRARYRRIAQKEGAIAGFAAGLAELRRTIKTQPRTPMPRALFDRLMGVGHAREALREAHAQRPFRTVGIVDEGKNGWVVRKALAELGVTILDPSSPVDSHSSPITPHQSPLTPRRSSPPDALVIGTMSPGPMLDAYERRTCLAGPGGPRIIAPSLAITRRACTPGADALTSMRASRRAKIPA